MRLTWRFAALAALLLAACREGDDPLAPSSEGLAIPVPRLDASTVLASGGSRERPPADSIRLLMQPSTSVTEAPLIYDYNLKAYIGWFSFGGLAEASAWMNYFGTTGNITTNVKVLKGSQLVNDATVQEPQSSFYAWARTIDHVVQVPFREPCDVRNESRSHFEASMPTAGPGTAISHASRNSWDMAELSPCTPPPEVVGATKSNGTDEDSGWAICWYQVWYDNYGNVVSAQELYCEPL